MRLSVQHKQRQYNIFIGNCFVIHTIIHLMSISIDDILVQLRHLKVHIERHMFCNKARLHDRSIFRRLYAGILYNKKYASGTKTE